MMNWLEKSSPPKIDADHRHDDVLGQAGRDLAERRADDHGDREVEHVALGDEGAEFPEHKLPPFLSSRRAEA